MLSVLIVDDSREDLMLAERVFRSCKLLNPVISMSTGEECIRYFEQGGTEEESGPALVFLDLAMSPASGLDVLRRIHTLPKAKQSIFVMLSGISDIKMLREGYQLGAQTFFVKPLRGEDVVEFLATVKKRIRVEETEEGYVLHWVTPPVQSKSQKKQTNRIVTLQA